MQNNCLAETKMDIGVFRMIEEAFAAKFRKANIYNLTVNSYS